MLEKVGNALKFLDGVASGLLKLVGLVVVLVIGSCYMAKDKPIEESKGVAKSVEVAPAVDNAPAAERAGCLCSAGASCAGPRGGVYCLTDAGARRYLPKP